MKNNNIFSTWEQASDKIEKNNRFSKNEIENYTIIKKAKKSTLGLKISIYINIVVQFSIIILSAINIYIYISNLLIKILSVSFLPVTLYFIVFGINKLKGLSRIEKKDNSLINILEEKISFTRSLSFSWPLIAAFTYAILVSLVNMIIDNDDGSYRINNWLLFGGIYLIAFGFIFIVNYISNLSFLKELRLQIAELKEEYRDTGFRKKRRIFILVAIIILTILFLFGLYVALK